LKDHLSQIEKAILQKLIRILAVNDRKLIVDYDASSANATVQRVFNPQIPKKNRSRRTGAAATRNNTAGRPCTSFPT